MQQRINNHLIYGRCMCLNALHAQEGEPIKVWDSKFPELEEPETWSRTSVVRLFGVNSESQIAREDLDRQILWILGGSKFETRNTRRVESRRAGVNLDHWSRRLCVNRPEDLEGGRGWSVETSKSWIPEETRVVDLWGDTWQQISSSGKVEFSFSSLRTDIVGVKRLEDLK